MAKFDALSRLKLSILFLLKHAGLPVTNDQLVRACSKYEWINYFELQQALLELLQTDLISEVQNEFGTSCYVISHLGCMALEHFQKELPYSLRKSFLCDAQMLHRAIKIEAEYLSDYQKNQDGTYTVFLKIIEDGSPILSITLPLFTMEQAMSVCEGWSRNAQDIYSKILIPFRSDQA